MEPMYINVKSNNLKKMIYREAAPFGFNPKKNSISSK